MRFYSYRNMCQSTNVASLATVLQYYLSMAEKRTDEAKQESQDNVEGVRDTFQLLFLILLLLKHKDSVKVSKYR